MPQAIQIDLVEKGTVPPWTDVKAIAEVNDGIRVAIVQGGTASGRPAVVLAVPLGNVSLFRPAEGDGEGQLSTAENGYAIVQLTTGSLETIAAALRGAMARWGTL